MILGITVCLEQKAGDQDFCPRLLPICCVALNKFFLLWCLSLLCKAFCADHDAKCLSGAAVK